MTQHKMFNSNIPATKKAAKHIKHNKSLTSFPALFTDHWENKEAIYIQFAMIVRKSDTISVNHDQLLEDTI